ncbi:hypothetical protein LOZ12_000523 [Ophidiomyces ophidiicola]|uniref:Uncharacterized protein n=1 Tax=Ophidiomyces ophidiicola TaxID=1387563 RepID=A0ACB8V4R4_9EURO|nr:uncharacterized protein LOZ57_003419 [Ophidiomyces ophidiicola]KAI1926050.1 hypothetical protein LOZ64_000367 [Ophidiomyces ophidiicola]KAI1947181.1 hypothetical protein LOZ57_003419 [Ophidiomyces ophidiicola]KAI1955697.1 hypothetical protein LOZ62_000248 [Ophidiomyces ophidiicola]KAI1975993.1 hypothetical protein LOZ56_000310 [Ophidiomyces ophidiicola]KAI2011360.1 hypothetical protein LOZ50_000720 [Ophidiomyces ophidiicola]
MTPYRAQDTGPILLYLNDPVIYKWLRTPPVPYTREHAETWVDMCMEIFKTPLRDGEQWYQNKTGWVAECPIKAIREVKRNELGEIEEVMIGDIGISRHTFDEILDEGERIETKKINDERKVGDEKIIWTIGDWLGPNYHGKGIMTACIKTLINWATINMNVHHIRVFVGVGNVGSRRVFEKNDFTYIETIKDAYELPEIKGGGSMSLEVLDWIRSKE